MPQRLVNIDDRALSAARRRLGTATIEETVNRALREAAGSEAERFERSLEILASVDWQPRADAWR